MTAEGRGPGYDLAVIGAGSAGFSAAITAAEAGARVALVGSGTLGGTCVNVGCVPSKALLRAVEPLYQARAAARFAGVAAEARLVNWSALVAQKDALVGALRAAKYADLLPAYPEIDYREGAARFDADGALTVDGARLSAPKVVIATGASPATPSVPGIEAIPCLTSATAMALARLPASLLVIGAGYVGAELCQLFARAGVAVTVVSRRGLLPGAEPEVAAALTGYLEAEGVRFVTADAYERVEATGGGARLAVQRDGETLTLEAEAVLAAAGRRPNTGRLGLEAAGIETDGAGAVRVDDRMRTTRPGVYAAGDVTGRDLFVYMAAHGAKIAALNALGDDAHRYDSAGMPAVVFTDPNLASAGLTEAAAREAGLAVETSMIGLEHLPRAIAARDTRGLVKLVAEADTGRLVGAHLLAPEAADSIQAAALAIRAGMTVEALGASVFPYLTTVEALKLAAQAFGRDVTRLSCCAG